VTIEFHCHHCDKTLKTTDDKAGRQAKCPGCGELITVPQPQSPVVDAVEDVSDLVEIADESSATPPPVPADPDATKECPFCGEQIRVAATKCRYCGERLEPPAEHLKGYGELRPFPPSETISDAWQIFTDQMGLSVGTTFVFLLLSGISAMLWFVPMQIAIEMGDQGNDASVVVGVFAAVMYVVSLALNCFLGCGYLIFLLKLARRQDAEVADLFRGGRRWLTLLGATFVFLIMFYLGFLMCIIPGVLVGLMFSVYPFVIVDQNLGVFAALGRSRAMTKGNWGSILLVFLMGIGCYVMGALACYVGLLFTLPYTYILFAVAYDKMTRQRPDDSVTIS